MSSAAHVNTDALRNLDSHLADFRARAERSLEQFHHALAQHAALLEHRRDNAQHDLRYWQAQRDEAGEEDDVNYICEQLLEAQERAAAIDGEIAKVEGARSNFEASARAMQRILNQEVPAARSFLAGKLGNLADYRSVALPGPPSSGLSGGAERKNSNASAAPLVAAGTVRDNTAYLRFYKLPPGFQWFDIDRIAPDELAALPSQESEFINWPHDSMKEAMLVLQKEILPDLQAKTVSQLDDDWRKRDASNPLPRDLRRTDIYSTFFHNDTPIVIDGYRGRYTITNGRHRIRVARELGWSCIPAKVMEVN